MGSSSEDLAIALLESKIASIEKQVYDKKLTADEASLIESLLAANGIVSASANAKPYIQGVFRRLAELNHDLTEEAAGIPQAEFQRKYDLVLSLYDQYRENAAAIEKMNRFNAELNHGNLKCLDEVRPELTDLVQQFASLRQILSETEPRDDLIASWHSLVLEVSKSLVAVNNALTELESTYASR